LHYNLIPLFYCTLYSEINCTLSPKYSPFIKKLESCDLLAVPGSGKTTALLAKLYCLSMHLPFNDGSGILVLSHTNAAVEEIEKNLKSFCPALFEYPNFIGTIQSFVNKFLANQACCIKYGSYISINDNDVYEKEANKFFNSLQWKKTEPKGLKNKLFGRVNMGIDSLSFEDKVENINKFLKNFELNLLERKIIYNGKPFYAFSGSSQACYLELELWKESLYEKGILNYRDSFYLGDFYLNTFPGVKSILQKKFRYVFIDEMQDLEKFQIDIIDKIFLGEGSTTTIQRIGDINQSIYNSGKRVKIEADWIPRNHMFLNNSNRLTSEIANIVNCFTLDRQQNELGNPRFVVRGLRRLDAAILPHMILFDNQAIGRLKNKFIELIRNYSLQKTKEAEKYGFKIIGWNAKWDDDEAHVGKLRLENMFESYKKEAKGNKETFDSLSKYLQLFDHEKTTLEAARKTLLNSLIHILRIENKTYQTRIRGKEIIRYFSKSEMVKHIQNENNIFVYELFKNKLYQWSFDLSTIRNYETVYNNVRMFILNEFKEWFDLTITQETSTFLGKQFERIIIREDRCQTENTSNDSIKIEIETVHAAKGQTHCATMYVETSYYEYETQKARIKEALKKEEHAFVLTNSDNKRGKQALKMMYVGFSRPTHLLCFACLKENIPGNIEDYISAGWKVIDLVANN
jgi:DNA helicase II / ATP-dependent DNA helicase PcrA